MFVISIAVLVVVPVSNAYAIGRIATGLPPTGQSRLVGNGSPEFATVPGAQETAGQTPETGQMLLSGHTVTPAVHEVTSLAPPLHLLVVGLQMGQGCMAAVSLTHEPPLQLAEVLHLRPTSLGGEPAPHRPRRISPVRNVVAESGMVICTAPELHVRLPLAFADSELNTQALSAELPGLTTGTGGP